MSLNRSLRERNQAILGLKSIEALGFLISPGGSGVSPLRGLKYRVLGNFRPDQTQGSFLGAHFGAFQVPSGPDHPSLMRPFRAIRARVVKNGFAIFWLAFG